MIVVPSFEGNARRKRRRRGLSLTVLFLFALPLFLAALFFALNAAFLAEARATLHNAADAAALAAVQTLVDDAWLTDDPNQQLSLIGRAQTQAQFYAAKNRVLGQPLALQLPATPTANPPDGDVVFAFLDEPRSPNPQERVLVVRDFDGTYNGGPFLPLVNTVRINARRSAARATAVRLLGGTFLGAGSADVEAPATATLDRDVVGFRPLDGIPLPLVPIALLTRAGPGAPSSWENELQKDNDNWKLDPASGLFSAGSDALPEATMVVDIDEAQASAALLMLGIPDLVGSGYQSIFGGQVTAGVSATDLQGLGGTFALSNSSNRLAVPTRQGEASFFADLANRLTQIQGQKRVWPLFESFEANAGQVVITGFVAARVVQASATSDGVTLILQPCLLSTRTAITNTAQRGVGGVNITNRYICKVRMVE